MKSFPIEMNNDEKRNFNSATYESVHTKWEDCRCNEILLLEQTFLVIYMWAPTPLASDLHKITLFCLTLLSLVQGAVGNNILPMQWYHLNDKLSLMSDILSTLIRLRLYLSLAYFFILADFSIYVHFYNRFYTFLYQTFVYQNIDWIL